MKKNLTIEALPNRLQHEASVKKSYRIQRLHLIICQNAYKTGG